MLRHLLISAVAFAALATPRPQDVDEFRDWVRDEAYPLTTLDWRQVTDRDLRFLERELEGKRIVFLGEPDHYIHEKYDYRLILIRYLYDRGWTHVGMEMGLSDGMRVDRYLASGDPAELDRVGLYGYEGAQRDDRDDSPRGYLQGRSPGLRKRTVAEERWFLGQLVALNQDRPVGRERLRWFGFDVDVAPGGGYEDARAILAGHAEREPVAELLERLERVDDESISDEIARLRSALRHVRQRFDELVALLGPASLDELIATLLCLHDSYELAEVYVADPSHSEMLRAFARREETMFRQVDQLLDELGPSAKVILMAHNMHLSKDHETVGFGNRGGGGVAMWPSIGNHVATRFPDEIYSIWMTFDRGRHSRLKSRLPFDEVETKFDTVEHVLGTVGDLFMLPLGEQRGKDAFLNAERNFVQNGDYGHGNLTRQADALFFVREVTQLRER